MAQKKSKSFRKSWEYCPNCDIKINELGGYEYYCKKCDTYYKKGREIFYTPEGSVIEVGRK